MAVYQPSAILGNGHTLVGVGERGELMSFYFPHIDFPQNLNQGMPALYLGGQGSGRLEWTFEPTWSVEQRYVGRSDILRTVCHHHQLGLEVSFTDFVLPHADVLVRRVEFRNRGLTPLSATFYQYLDLQLDEVPERNGVRWFAEQGELVQYWRNLAFAVGGDKFDQFGCGKAGPDSGNSAKLGMTAGRLNSNLQEIGDVDLAVGWEMQLLPGQELTRTLLITAAGDEPGAISKLAEAKARGFAALRQETEQDARAFLAPARTVKVPADLEESYWRGLLLLRLLFDQSYGTFLAAPEFDPAFERSGGYGYCWPRDAAEVVLALEAAGLPDMGLRFLEWARTAQKEDGSWEQRYWLNGERGPAWCAIEGHFQIDQVGSMLLAMEKLITALHPEEQREMRARFWPNIQRAADYLSRMVDPASWLHRPGCDLWETYRGSFTYTNAAVWAGLRAGAALAGACGQADSAEQWNELARKLKQAVLGKFWLGHYFARGIGLDGQLDSGVDSSILGLIDPFQLLDLNDPCEREMAEACADTVTRYLSLQIDGKSAIGRFQGDQYLGGSAGGVNTLWLARVLLRLALHYQEIDPARAEVYQTRALDYLRVVQARATAAGMLPELIGGPASARWAAPHGWATASYIANMILLDCLAANEGSA